MLTIIETNYQRNGVAGESFAVVRFNYFDYPVPLIAIIPGKYDPEYYDNGIVPPDITSMCECYVIDPSNLNAHWRGDRIFDELLQANVWDRINADADVRYRDVIESLALVLDTGND